MLIFTTKEYFNFKKSFIQHSFYWYSQVLVLPRIPQLSIQLQTITAGDGHPLFRQMV